MSTQKLFNIESARSTEDIKVTKDLFETYAISLGFDLAFQNFDAEMLDFPGKYSPPKGELFLARDIKGVPIGCVGLRPLTPEGCCEMKRLYILPAGRGLGIGKALVKAVVDVAIRLGYTEMKLDTLPSMVEAISLYKSAGFLSTEPYYSTPMAGTIFLAYPLRSSSN